MLIIRPDSIACYIPENGIRFSIVNLVSPNFTVCEGATIEMFKPVSKNTLPIPDGYSYMQDLKFEVTP